MAILVAGALAWPSSASPPAAKSRPVNHLARETSPYLLQHAHNPVDWYPWGPEAFAKAKKEDKLVFLSIGYSSCHWCHVMEQESFAKPAVAKLLNQWFVCIKVDREERPDIDHIYMTALEVYGSSGGWPLSMFLTADGKPIFGGTYWPPDDKEVEDGTIRGFKSILKAVHELQLTKAKALQKQADRLAAATTKALAGTLRGLALADLNRDLVAGAVASMKEEYDKVYGGFGSAERKFRGPKFPLPSYLRLLQYESGRTRSAELAGMVRNTLDHMARGGIYDQLGGGFHRYSTERTWTVPHFEKMLYDNAQLLEVYARAYRETKKPLYRRILRETLAFVRREMMSPEGPFYSALDADSDGVEGRFYVWTAKEINAALADKAGRKLFQQIYGADGPPNFESNYYILFLPEPLADQAKKMQRTEDQLLSRLGLLRQKLLEARAKRSRPFLDTKVLAGWNGQMIAGFALAGQALGEEKPGARPHIDAAIKAADFVLRKMRTRDGRLLRTYAARSNEKPAARLPAYLDDYAYLVHGLLCLHDVTGQPRWLDEARRLTDTMVKFYADPKGGGFFYTANDHERLFARAKDQFDGAQPAGNSVSARNFVRLWQKTGDDHYQKLAEKTFQAFAGSIKVNPSGLTAMAEALALYLDARDVRVPAPLSAKEKPAGGGTVKNSAAFVQVNAQVVPEKPGPDGRQVVTVTLRIDKDWHLGANPPGEFGVATTVKVQSTTARLAEVKVDYPQGRLINDPAAGSYRVYEGKVVIPVHVRRAEGDNGPLQITIKFAACSDREMKCLPTATVTRMVPKTSNKGGSR